ncbi:MAG: tRNA (adenosine(37)-N6)-threonylcarbamoyltransferase complex ATPase subunit type 1 TsaE [Gammaproteobacteria bacterium]|nr:tRNA (adenosine(37)-N6)-threonylcarbamoyltransferase complex ATPase subunit type 1 TsaE [Gammaproteobacteria bacterium]MDH5651022.1 tRNA (adenosine(37)-N6)-threonylcarbamoyltransferase complex ATPase subunit type 1 TsaE [Gammaproteobacteria bacterium]
MKCIELSLADEAATLQLGAALAANTATTGATIFLIGDLGAGKTTLVRGLLQAMGHQGKVKSPTYTLVEPYEVGERQIYHFDLYRLSDPEELEYAGARDYFGGDNLCLVEWPERGKGWLAVPDLQIELSYAGTGRTVRLCAHTARGSVLTSGLAPD